MKVYVDVLRDPKKQKSSETMKGSIPRQVSKKQIHFFKICWPNCKVCENGTWTLNLVKGLLADSDTLSKIAKKVWVIWKNCKYVFCSFWCDLFEKNILVNICWLRCWLNWVEFQKSAKFPAKNTKYVNGRGGFLLWGIWPQYLGKRHFKASFRRSQTHMVLMWVHTSESKVKKSWKMWFWAYFGTSLLT